MEFYYVSSGLLPVSNSASTDLKPLADRISLPRKLRLLWQGLGYGGINRGFTRRVDGRLNLRNSMLTVVRTAVADGSYLLFRYSTRFPDTLISSSTVDRPPVISRTLPLRLLLLPDYLVEYGRLDGRLDLRNSMMTVVLPTVAED